MQCRYSVIEVDYRKNVMAPKATCTYCNKKFNPERLKVHLRYFCGPYAQKTEGQAKQDKKRGSTSGAKVCSLILLSTTFTNSASIRNKTCVMTACAVTTRMPRGTGNMFQLVGLAALLQILRHCRAV